jgi:hypothetical protein
MPDRGLFCRISSDAGRWMVGVHLEQQQNHIQKLQKEWKGAKCRNSLSLTFACLAFVKFAPSLPFQCIAVAELANVSFLHHGTQSSVAQYARLTFCTPRAFIYEYIRRIGSLKSTSGWHSIWKSGFQDWKVYAHMFYALPLSVEPDTPCHSC